MISSEVLRRYPFFARLSMDQLNTLAKLATEITVETDHFFFREDEELKKFYLVLEGAVAVVFELPAREVEHKVSEQFERKLQTKDVVVSTVGPGDLFGWSGLVPPHNSNAGAKALTPCRVVSFDCQELMSAFDEDCKFGYIMTQKAAQILAERLRDLRIESLSSFV